MGKRKIFLYLTVAFIILFSTMSVWAYNAFRGKNFLSKKGDQPVYIYIKEGVKFMDVLHLMEDQHIINDGLSFAFTAKLMKYQENVKPGRFMIKPGMNNIEVVRLLRSGKRDVSTITFNNVKKHTDLAEAVCGVSLPHAKDELDSLVKSQKFLSNYGFDISTVIAMFVPNTYQIYWDESAKELFERMFREYNKFWTEDRLNKAKSLELSPQEIVTLASIVQGETLNKKEQKTVAGLYLNRVKKGMKLEADPTLAYVSGKSGKEILNKHKLIDSPYNTYMYAGLPPGPIAMPDAHVVDAVLNYEEHEYIFMCAKGDGSGTHNFAKTNRQHNNNVSLYKKNLRIYLKNKK